MIKILFKNKILVAIVLNTCAIIAICCFLFLTQKSESIVYINSPKVFEEFNMTKEIKKDGEKNLKQRSKTVDSLYNLIQLSANQTNELLIKEFASQKEDLETFTNNFYTEQSLKIWARIKDYSAKFSEENNYEIVLGSQQGETIIYGSATRDVSDAFITYINERYEGNR